jgi:hypothetical protein
MLFPKRSLCYLLWCSYLAVSNFAATPSGVTIRLATSGPSLFLRNKLWHDYYRCNCEDAIREPMMKLKYEPLPLLLRIDPARVSCEHSRHLHRIKASAIMTRLTQHISCITSIHYISNNLNIFYNWQHGHQETHTCHWRNWSPRSRSDRRSPRARQDRTTFALLCTGSHERQRGPPCERACRQRCGTGGW